MRKARWLADWRDSEKKPVFYHCISRVVDGRFAFGGEEKEKFRTIMRLQEKFTGCRVVAYCLMCNHFHLLLEVPPMLEGGLSDGELLKRLRAIYSEAFVAGVAKELADAETGEYAGEGGRETAVRAIHARFTYRMHDLGEFMKGLLQKFTQWFNRSHSRTGTLWEDRFKSVIVEDGVAAKTMAAYIDLNPVRAGIVTEPGDYRWSSYGEAIGGGAKGNGKTARAGLVRALKAHQGITADADLWSRGISSDYRKLLMSGAVDKNSESVGRDGTLRVRILRKGIPKGDRAIDEECQISFSRMLRHKIRYFTDGAIIGSRLFVNEAFANARSRSGPKRKDGARKLRGLAEPMAGALWSFRDLKKGIC